MPLLLPGKSAAWEEAKHNAVVCFAEVLQRRLYLEFGFSSIQQYARVELKFSDTRTGDFVRLAGKMVQLPMMVRVAPRPPPGG